MRSLRPCISTVQFCARQKKAECGVGVCGAEGRPARAARIIASELSPHLSFLVVHITVHLVRQRRRRHVLLRRGRGRCTRQLPPGNCETKTTGSESNICSAISLLTLQVVRQEKAAFSAAMRAWGRLPGERARQSSSSALSSSIISKYCSHSRAPSTSSTWSCGNYRVCSSRHCCLAQSVGNWHLAADGQASADWTAGKG